MKILYNFWGYLSNRYGISAPDGNASYSPWIINGLTNLEHKVLAGPIDRDKPIIDEHGLEKSFSGFMTEERIKAYKSLQRVDLDNLPDVDAVLLEWRFKTPYNSVSKDSDEYSPDLEIQDKLIERYKGNAKIVVMDLDHQFTQEDAEKLGDHRVISQHEVSLGAPVEALTPELNANPTKLLSYVGNDYRRREDIDKKIVPLSDLHPGKVHFYGNWLREDKDDFRKARPNIVYHGRIGLGDFQDAMSDALGVPLLAPEDYKDQGFMTYRIAEALMFGSIPVGYSDFKGIDRFIPERLIVDADNPTEGTEKVLNYFKLSTLEKRTQIRDEIAKKVANQLSVDKFLYEVLK